MESSRKLAERQGKIIGSILGGGKKVKPPTPQKVAPIPTVTTEAEDEALRKGKGAGGGFQGTILVGALEPKSTGKLKVLG